MNKLFCGLLVSLFINVGANAQIVEGSWEGCVPSAEWRRRQ